MAGVTVQLAQFALIDPITIALALPSLALIVLLPPNTSWMILVGGVIGLARELLA